AAIAQFRQAVQLAPERAGALGDLAWLLATAPDPAIRDAAEAISLAERAVNLTGRRDAGSLDILAAAYASAGLFDRAIETSQAGLSVAPTGPADAMRQRLELYKQRQPYRSPTQRP